MGPDLDDIIDALPQAGVIHILVRDDGAQYDRHETEMGASHSKEYLERLMSQLKEAEIKAQMDDAVEAWLLDLVARGVPEDVAQTLPAPGIDVLRGVFDFFESHWHIRTVEIIDAEKAIRREAMHARAAALEV